MTVAEVLAALESLAPPRLAFSYDRVGLQVGDPGADVRRGMVALDASDDAVESCLAQGRQVLILHHPIIWDPLSRLVAEDRIEARILRLARQGVAVIAAHTNWDTARGGVNDVLAQLLGLREVVAFGSAPCDEEPKMAIGRMGVIDSVSLDAFVAQVDRVLGCRAMAWGDPARVVRSVAVVGGAADDEWTHALAGGADVLVTGEVRHHVSRDAGDAGIAMVAAGHYFTENPGLAALAERMRETAPEVEWHFFAPEKGRGGHPWYA